MSEYIRTSWREQTTASQQSLTPKMPTNMRVQTNDDDDDGDGDDDDDDASFVFCCITWNRGACRGSIQVLWNEEFLHSTDDEQ